MKAAANPPRGKMRCRKTDRSDLSARHGKFKSTSPAAGPAVLLGLLLLLFLTHARSQRDPTMSAGALWPAQSPAAPEEEIDIKVITPQPDALVISPIRVSGRARGVWFFEGTFPVVLLDNEGRVMATTQAKSQGEWMTEEFVDFVATVSYRKATTSQGTLLLRQAAARGGGSQKTHKVPVRFDFR